MGEFDLETDAALAQLNYDELARTPGGEFAEIIGDLVALVGSGGFGAVAGGASNLILKIRRLAGASYASNLIYAIAAVRNDLADLYQKHAALRARIESLGSDPQFARAIAGLALRSMHTSVQGRLGRLAKVVVNGMRDRDLGSENLDELMRAAVELRDIDIAVLSFISVQQGDLLEGNQPAIDGWPHNWINEVQKRWQDSLLKRSEAFPQKRFDRGEWHSALARLQAFGFVTPIQPNPTANSPGEEPYAFLRAGQKFLRRIGELD